MVIKVVAISKARTGLNENLPQLAGGELGWSIDTQQLFIGSGSTYAGAPSVGNIEILTIRSNVSGGGGGSGSIVTSDYTLQGTAGGFTVQTGANIGTPIVRTVQSKVDDFISVKDFGARGNGVADDTAAINRAISQLYITGTTSASHRGIYFPAGVYLITNVITLPTYAKIFGDGIDNTIIRQTGAAVTIQTTDTANHFSPFIGTAGATAPQSIYAANMTWENTTDRDIFVITETTNSHFHAIKFVGPKTSPTTVDNSKSCVTIESTATLKSSNIIFDNCVFTKHTYACVADTDMYNIVFNNCTFKTLYAGIKVGESTTGSGASITGPIGVKVSNSVFDAIATIGFRSYVTRNGSINNTYLDVGNGIGGSAVSAVIQFDGTNNYSIGDTFTRTGNASFSRINFVNRQNYAVISGQYSRLGPFTREVGNVVTLSDNMIVAANTTIAFNDSNSIYNAVKIPYKIVRGNDVRSGELNIVQNSTAQSISDNYLETNPTGVTFSLSHAANVTNVQYTTTSTGNVATLEYSITYFN